MRQSGRVIALSRPTCLNSQNTCVGFVPRMQVCLTRGRRKLSSIHRFSKQELGNLGRECHVGDEEQSQTDFVYRICSSHPAQGKWSAYSAEAERSGATRTPSALDYCALVSGRSRNLSRFAIPSGSGCA